MTTTESASAAPEGTGEYTHRQILTILSGLMLAMLLAALDQTIVSTSIRTIADDLNGLSAQAWTTTAYLVTMSITTPIYAKLGDLYGRKKLFLFAIVVFLVGSAACSFAGSMTQLAISRAFQGLGAGGLIPQVLAIIGDIVSPRERARYTGYFMATFATSSVLGPVVGGFLAGQDTLLGLTGWRWVFLVNVPIGLVALAVVTRTLQVHAPPGAGKNVRIDWWGAVTLSVAVVPLLVVAEQGREWGWGSPGALLCYAVGAAGIIAFVAVQRAMGDDALIPLRIFRLRPAAVGIGASVIIGMAMFGAILTLPLYLQIVHGASPTESGLLMLPMVLGIMTAATGSGRLISKTGQTRIFPIIGSALATVGMVLISFTGADTSLWLVGPAMFVLGFGLGNCMQPLILILQSSVPPREIGVATGAATFFRQIGGTLGVAIFLSLLFGSLGGNIGSAVEDAARTPEFQQVVRDPQVQADPLDGEVIRSLRDPSSGGGVLERVQDDSSIVDEMNPVLGHPFKVGFADSMDQVFRVAAGVTSVAFLILLLMPQVELRETSASAQARADAAKQAEAPE